jgi:hypothetical protein
VPVTVLTNPADRAVGVIAPHRAPVKIVSKTARELKVGSGTVQRIKAAMLKQR